MDLYWGRTSPAGPWEERQVSGTVWGDPDDRFSDQPDIAVTPDGEPVILARWQRRAVTGSLKESELRVYAPAAEGDWCYDIVTADPDGYRGGDGEKFTGEAPRIALDGQGRIHVAFHDRTSWHANNQSNGIQGQLRYALHDGQGWTVTTLLEQPGQAESPNPLHGFRHGIAAPTQAGDKVFFAGVQGIWQTDSIYNNDSAPISYKAQVFRAALSY